MREVEQLTEEARVTLNEFHTLAEMTGIFLIQQITNSGGFGGLSARQKDEQRDQIAETLKKIGVSTQASATVNSAGRLWVMADYASAVMRSIENAESSSDELKASVSEMRGRWNTEGFRPLPADFEEMLQDAPCVDQVTVERVEDYTHYYKTGEHRRPAVWRNHDDWFR